MVNLNCLGRWSEQWEEEAHNPKTCNYPFTIKYKSPLSDHSQGILSVI